MGFPTQFLLLAVKKVLDFSQSFLCQTCSEELCVVQRKSNGGDAEGTPQKNSKGLGLTASSFADAYQNWTTGKVCIILVSGFIF